MSELFLAKAVQRPRAHGTWSNKWDSSARDQWFSLSSNMLNHDIVYFACFTQCFSASTKNTLHPTCIKIFSPIGWIKAFRFRDVSQTFPNKPCNVDWTPEETEMRLQSFWIVITMGCSAWRYLNYQKFWKVYICTWLRIGKAMNCHCIGACCQYISIFQLRIRHTEAILQSNRDSTCSDWVSATFSAHMFF